MAVGGFETQKALACRVLVADSQPVVRMGLAAIFSGTRGLQVVGQAGDRHELFDQLEAARPDVVIVDPSIDDGAGFELLSQIQDRFGSVSIIALTSACSDLGVIESLKSGAMAFLTKDAPADNIVQAVRAVMKGDFYLDPTVTSTVVGAVGRRNDRRRSSGRQLTERERDVLELLVEGKRNREISESLHISERTVKFHIRALFQKLRASNRTEVVIAAVNKGLVGTKPGKGE